MAIFPLGQSGSGRWAAALLVSIGFLALWTLALLRLHAHSNGEAFMHWNGCADTLLAFLAPIAISVRLAGLFGRNGPAQ